MKPFFAMIIAISLVACNCDEDTKTNHCDFSDSIDEYPWIVELKNTLTNCTCEIAIIQGTYHGRTVVFITVTDPACNSTNTPILYNCEGKPIRSFSSSETDQEELRSQVTSDVVLYRCKT